MSLDPTRTKDIPSNVTAQILPKTLFGEQYVSLVIPKHRDRSIRQGDVIPQDRSRGALESQNVISDLFPLLTAVRPAELNSTLTALADALHGRGDELGQTLVNFDRYLKVINPHTRQLVDDIEKLGRVAIEYNDVAPDIFTTLRNLQTSARTLVEKQKGLDSLLATGSDASGVLKSFLSDNEQRIITVTGQTNKVFPLLNKFSPEFSCLFTGLNKLYNLAGQAIYDNQIHLSATVDANLKPYKPGQEPRFVSGFGPNCFGLPHPPKPFQIPNAYKCVNDGVPLSDAPCAQSAGADDKALNSRAENSYVDTLHRRVPAHHPETTSPARPPCSRPRCCAATRWCSNEGCRRTTDQAVDLPGDHRAGHLRAGCHHQQLLLRCREALQGRLRRRLGRAAR